MSFDLVANIVMLILGVVLFAFGLWVVKNLMRKNRSPVPSYPLLGLAVSMIGYSSIKSFNILHVIDVEKQTAVHVATLAQNLAKTPNDPKAIADLGKALDLQLSTTNTFSLSAAARLNLDKAATALSRQTNLTADSRIALAKSQLVLGQTNAAARTLNLVAKMEPHRLTDPKFRVLLERARE